MEIVLCDKQFVAQRCDIYSHMEWTTIRSNFFINKRCSLSIRKLLKPLRDKAAEALETKLESIFAVKYDSESPESVRVAHC